MPSAKVRNTYNATESMQQSDPVLLKKDGIR